MDLSEIELFLYISFLILVGIPYLILVSFWLQFILSRIYKFNKNYKKFRFLSKLDPELCIDFFNCKIKLVIHVFLLFLLLSEIMSAVGYTIGTSLVSYFSLSHMSPQSLKIPLNCTDGGFELWQFELTNPFVALVYAVGNVSVVFIFVLLIGLLKFIFLAYQNKTNFKSVKSYVIYSSFLPPFFIALYTIPQTQLLAKASFIICEIVVLFLLFKHKKSYFLILKWRCDDAFTQQNSIDFAYHSRIRRNSKFSFNMVCVGFAIIVIAMLLDSIPSILSMLFTEKSKYVTRTFNSDVSLAFLDCPSQKMIYRFRSVFDTIVPLLMLAGMSIYTLPLIGVSVGLMIRYVYYKCKRVDSEYFRVKGNVQYLIDEQD